MEIMNTSLVEILHSIRGKCTCMHGSCVLYCNVPVLLHVVIQHTIYDMHSRLIQISSNMKIGHAVGC